MNNVKTGDYVQIEVQNGIPENNLTVGKKYKVIDYKYNTPHIIDDDGDEIGLGVTRCAFLGGGKWKVVDEFQNRDFLRDFVSLNKIKTTLVSKQLGYSRNWLTQAMNRTDRGDLTNEELQEIMKQLHVDWTNTQYVNVKATATHAAYRTRPCVYEHAKHKELLQRAFWDGRFTQ